MARQAALLAVLVLVVAGNAFADDPEKIVGGSDATLGEFPYQVSLRYFEIHFCGGTLVSDRHIVTAGHCIDGTVTAPYKEFTVVTGTVDAEKGGEIHQVKDVIVHKGFINEMITSLPNDIAVVILEKPLIPNKYQSPIPIATADPPVNAALTLSGWGLTEARGVEAKHLQKATVYALSNEECQKLNKKYYIFDSHLCTRSPRGIGACQGDSGGPLFYNGELVGVVSWVFPCALGKPDVYTRASHYVGFVKNAMKR